MADKDQELIKEALDRFEASEEVWSDNFQRYEDDVKFARKGEQWEWKDIEQRKNEGRPALTVNRMPSFIRQVTNDARQNKPQIKVLPQDSVADPNTAEVINGLIRNIESTSKADLAYDTAVDCSATGGFGYFRIDLDYCDQDTFEMDIEIDRILNPLTVYPDANSTAADSSDWNYCFVTEVLPDEEFEEKYPDAEKVDFRSMTLDERERSWFDEEGVRIGEYWVREEEEYDIHQLNTGEVVSDEMWNELEEAYNAMGVSIVKTRKSTKPKVTQYIMTGVEVLEKNEWPGKYIPIVPVFGEEVYVEGERHLFGLIHFAKDSQRMFNYWRTATTELVALAPKAPWIGPVGAFSTDQENWQVANTETLPFLEYDGDIPPQRQPFAGPPAGALQEALNASDDMKAVMGLYDAALGAQSNEIAGVAIKQRRAEGDNSTFHFIDNMSRAIRHAGLIILDLIPHVYSKPRMVRVLGEDGSVQTVKVNQKFENMEETLQGQYTDQMEAMDAIYDLNVGKYDVTVKAGPNYATQREEARDSMIALLQAFPQAAQVTGDLVVESMDWPNADAFAKRLKAVLPPGVLDESQDPQAAALAAQIQEMDAVIQQLMAGRDAKMAEIAVDKEKLAIDAENATTNRVKAETDRLKAEVDAEYKRRQLELDAAKALKEEPVDDTAVTIKTMELNHDQAKTEIDTALEQEKLEIEKSKLALEQEKIGLERYKAEVEACAKIADATKPEVEVQPVMQQDPVQVFNVQNGAKNIDIKRDADGNIVGAEVREE